MPNKKLSQISQIKLERYLLKELSHAELKEIEKEIENDKSLRKRLENIKKSDGEILKKYKPSDMARQILLKHKISESQKVEKKKAKSFLSNFQILSAATAVCALAIVLLLPNIQKNSSDYNNLARLEKTRIKGDASKLFIYLQRNNRIDLLSEGSVVFKGDLIQAAYLSEADFGVILSIDGRGKVSLHFPLKENLTTKLNKNQKTKLPYSYELDDAPAFERFFFLFSDNEIDLKKVLRSAEILAQDNARAFEESLDAGENTGQISFRLIKGERN
ncbi:MAG: hypothetical protein OEZ13_07980 [Spirochaetia bacterium]|nr:hypothetical protein [Spirochaetia bacterium]